MKNRIIIANRIQEKLCRERATFCVRHVKIAFQALKVTSIKDIQNSLQSRKVRRESRLTIKSPPHVSTTSGQSDLSANEKQGSLVFYPHAITLYK